MTARMAFARKLASGGSSAIRISERLASAHGPTLAGDRWIEWSFCISRLSDEPGSTLDFGADSGFLSLAAARRGHDVVAFDRLPSSLDYEHPNVTHVRGDILDRSLQPQSFDQILNCSSVEHVGLGGRYGSLDNIDGDLEAMSIMRDLLTPGGRMIMTVPVGRDLICSPQHRVYGDARLPRLIEGFEVIEAEYWKKDPAAGLWQSVTRDEALAETGSDSFYALGLFVLGRAG